MPHYIVRLKKGEEVRYLEWSTIVDAPITYGMERAEFASYHRAEYPNEAIEPRLARADLHGTSAMDGTTVKGLLALNRAGPRETSLDFDGIWEKYVTKRGQS